MTEKGVAGGETSKNIKFERRAKSKAADGPTYCVRRSTWRCTGSNCRRKKTTVSTCEEGVGGGRTGPLGGSKERADGKKK